MDKQKKRNILKVSGSVALFSLVFVTTYVTYDTKEQLFNRDIARLLRETTRVGIESYQEAPSGIPEYMAIPKVVVPDLTLEAPQSAEPLSESARIAPPHPQMTEQDSVNEYRYTAPNQKPFLTREEVEYVINNAGLEGCISGFVVDRLKKLHKVELDKNDLTAQINAEMSIELQQELEQAQKIVDTQSTVIEMYQEKDSPIFGGWTGFAVSAVVGKLVLMVLSWPFTFYARFFKK